MYRKSFIFSLLIIFLFTTTAWSATGVKSKSLSGKVICLDPGHQAKSDLTMEPIGPGSATLKIKDGGGAEGIVSHTPEYEIALDVAFRVKKLLEAKGCRVVMTRTKNQVSLGNVKRAQIANNSKADLFVRIHCDGNDNPQMSGTSVLYPTKNQWTVPIYQDSKLAAQSIQKSLVKELDRQDKGIVERGDLTGFNWSKVPVILVEIAFLSNKEEDRLLNTPSFREKVAQGIYQGIENYLQK